MRIRASLSDREAVARKLTMVANVLQLWSLWAAGTNEAAPVELEAASFLIGYAASTMQKKGRR